MNSFFIFLNKPAGCTSHDILTPHKKKYGKIGHSGTLDPFATGLIIAGVNKALKVIKYLNGLDKTYDVKMLLGIKTDSQDITGNITGEKKNNITDEMLNLFSNIKGELVQKIPSLSAKKYKGKRLYKYARQGEKVPELTKKINIMEIQNLKLKDDLLSFKITCSAGTYIRALTFEAEKIFGAFSVVKELKRTKIGPFKLESQERIFSIKDILEQLMPVLKLEKEDEYKIKSGMRLRNESFGKDTEKTLAVIENQAAACGFIKNYVFHPKEVLL